MNAQTPIGLCCVIPNGNRAQHMFPSESQPHTKNSLVATSLSCARACSALIRVCMSGSYFLWMTLHLAYIATGFINRRSSSYAHFVAKFKLSHWVTYMYRADSIMNSRTRYLRLSHWFTNEKKSYLNVGMLRAQNIIFISIWWNTYAHLSRKS